MCSLVLADYRFWKRDETVVVLQFSLSATNAIFSPHMTFNGKEIILQESSSSSFKVFCLMTLSETILMGRLKSLFLQHTHQSQCCPCLCLVIPLQIFSDLTYTKCFYSCEKVAPLSDSALIFSLNAFEVISDWCFLETGCFHINIKLKLFLHHTIERLQAI